MSILKVLSASVVLAVMAACQPELIQVEVTRLVEVEPEVVVVTSSAAEERVAKEVVEVTRLVSVEVTRVISRTVEETVAIEVTKPPPGAPTRPIQLLFSPTVSSEVIMRRGQALAETLAAASGKNFEIGIVDDQASLIQLMCAAPEETVGFLTALAYVAAHEQCGVQAGNVSLDENGFAWQAGMIVVRRDSGVVAFQELAGKTWAVPDMGSIARYGYFLALFADAGIEVGEVIEVPGDSSAMLAVYNGEADFATATFVPPILPFEERQWEYGTDDPEIWRRLGIAPLRSPIGYILVNGEPEFGGYRLRDARSRVFDIVPGIYNETRIISLSAPIPNATVAFGSDFPLGTGRGIISGLTELASSGVCGSSLCSAEFYAWAGLAAAEESAYEPLQFMVSTLGITSDEFSNP